MKKILTGFFAHWNAFFCPQKKGHIDWKTIGQLRGRLGRMNAGEGVDYVPVYATPELARGFNLLNHRTTDREGLARWYGQCNGAMAEQKLHEKIEAGQRVITALKQSGQFPAILPEDAQALREVHLRFISPELSVSDVEDVHGHSPHSLRYLTSQPDDTIQDIPVITDEMIAALENSMKLDSISSLPGEAIDSHAAEPPLKLVDEQEHEGSPPSDLLENLKASNVMLFRPRAKIQR